MWHLGSLCLLCLWLVPALSDDDVRLRATVRKDVLERVPSCIESYSQVELLNLDNAEPITIHSITTEMEETVLVKDGENIRIEETLPQQLHFSRLSTRFITLGAKQIAIVPLTFVPRYPQTKGSNAESHGEYFAVDHEHDSPMSDISFADLQGIVGKEVLPNNARWCNRVKDKIGGPGDLYEVYATIVIDTSRGVVKLPVVVSSIRQNDYNVPEVITFPTEVAEAHGVPADANVTDPGRASQSLEVGTQTHSSAPLSGNCRDIYLTNPSSENELSVLEVRVSRPDLASIRLLGQNETGSEDSGAYRQSITDWGDGTLTIMPGAKDAYIAQVCAEQADLRNVVDQKQGKLGREPPTSLGFVSIRTEKNTIITWLDSLQPEENIVKSFHDEAEVPNTTSTDNQQKDRPKSSITFYPSRIELQLIPGVQTVDFGSIAIRNSFRYPIRIRRAKPYMHSTSGVREWMRKLNYNTDFDFRTSIGPTINSNDTNSSSWNESNDDRFNHLLNGTRRLVIPGNGELDTAVVLKTFIPQNMTIFDNHTDPVHFEGAIVVRATSRVNETFEEWKKQLAANPWLETDMVLEVPFTMAILDGRVHYVVDYSVVSPAWRYEETVSGFKNLRSVKALFFPLHLAHAISGSDNGQISYRLRLIGSGHIPLYLENITIRDEVDGLSQDVSRGSICERFSVSNSTTYLSEPGGGPHSIGVLWLTYSPRGRLRGHARNDAPGEIPTTCYLEVTTGPIETGIHRISLIVYGGDVSVSTSDTTLKSSAVPLDSSSLNATSPQWPNAFTSPVLIGLERIAAWMDSSSLGLALRKLIRRTESRSNDTKQLLDKYMLAISPSARDENNVLQPILIDVGAIGYGDAKTTNLYLTNRNPLPVTVSIDVGEMEGASITVAKDHNEQSIGVGRIFDYLSKADDPDLSRAVGGKWAGHSLDGLRYFLTSSELGISQLEPLLPYQDAINPSQDITSSDELMEALYKRNAMASFHADSSQISPNSRTKKCGAVDRPPPEYFSLSGRGEPSTFLVPLVFSDDLHLIHSPILCRDLDRKGTVSRLPDFRNPSVVIPPGGVARFDVNYRAPPHELLARDVTSFVSSGLVLSTDFGAIMPIIATFEALVGQVHLSTSKTPKISETIEVVDVPSGLFAADAATSDNSSEISLFVMSSFSQDIVVKSIESCNPWFHVDLEKSESGADAVGVVRSWMNCDPFYLDEARSPRALDDLIKFPTFFQCALTWLRYRSLLQPRGCGMPSRGIGSDVSEAERHSSEEDIIDFASSSFVNAVYYAAAYQNDKKSNFSKSDVDGFVKKSSSARSDGLVPRTVVDVFAGASYAWKKLTELGLNVVSTSLRATVAYSHTSEGGSNASSQLDGKREQNVTVSMNNLAVQTSLHIPKLLDLGSLQEEALFAKDEPDILQVTPTRVADIATVNVPIRNPTAMPVKVRLAFASKSNLDDKKFEDKYFNTNGFDRFEDFMRDDFLMDFEDVYIQNGGTSPKANKGTAMVWWEGDGAFFVPDDSGQLMQSRHNKTTIAGKGAHVTFVNPTLHGTHSLLVGCGKRCNLRDEEGKQGDFPYSPGYSTSSFSGASASVESALRRTTASGSLAFTPPAFAIPYSALDEIILPPFGTAELGPILFRPPGRHGTGRCIHEKSASADGCESRFFESMILLENTLNGLERVILRGQSVWERVAFLDAAPSNNAEESHGSIVMRQGLPTLVFSRMPRDVSPVQRLASDDPILQEVVVKNTGEIPVTFGSVYFSTRSRQTGPTERLSRSDPSPERILRYQKHAAASAIEGCSVRGFKLIDCRDKDELPSSLVVLEAENIRHGFHLEPGANRSIFIQYLPDCSHRKEFLSLIFEYRRSDKQVGSLPFQAGRAPRRRSPFSPNSVELAVGFEMISNELSSCCPAKSFDFREGLFPLFDWKSYNTSKTTGRSWTWRISDYRYPYFGITVHDSFLSLCAAIGFCAVVALNSTVAGTHLLRRMFVARFQSTFRGPKAKHVTRHSKERGGGSKERSNWPAAFRCLARTDPTSLELQTFSREQAKQILNQYKGEGSLAPQCITSAGILVRERSGAGKSGSASGNEKVLTLSDAIFNSSTSGTGRDIDGLTTISLGWRPAVARGVVNKMSGLRNSLKSTELLKQRPSTEGMRHGEPSADSNSEETSEMDESFETNDEASVDAASIASEESDEIRVSGDVISTSDSEGTSGFNKDDEGEASSSGRIAQSNLHAISPSQHKATKAKEHQKAQLKNKTFLKAPSTTAQAQVETKDAKTSGNHEDTKLPVQKASVDRAAVKDDHKAAKRSGRTNVTEVSSRNLGNKPTQKTVTASAVPKKASGKTPKKLLSTTTGKHTVTESGYAGAVASPAVQRRTIPSAQSSPASCGRQFSPASLAKQNRSAPPLSLDFRAATPIRPPPGLAPPPGFGNGSVASNTSTPDKEKSTVARTPLRLDSDFPPLPSHAPSAAQQPLSPTLFPKTDGATPPPVPIASSPIVTAKAGGDLSDERQTPLSPPLTERPVFGQAESGFNVMDFLDSILEDRNATNAEEGPGDLLSENNLGTPVTGPPVPLTSDPWAAERRSRASAYGISMDDDDEDDSESDGVVQAMWAASPLRQDHSTGSGRNSSLSTPIPFLLPAAIIRSEDDDSDVNQDQSFYARLLRE